jgi:hypothetical protein
VDDVRVCTAYGDGVATVNHASSSYGLPVVVVDGVAYGPAEIGPVGLPTNGPEDENVAEMHRALKQAGYEVNV